MSHQTQTYYVPGASPSAQSYAKFLHDTSNIYPILRNLESELPKYNRTCRVRLIDVPPSRENGHEFKTPQELNDHLAQQQLIPPAPRCRVYVVENLNLEYISVVGYHLNLDPTVFAKQVGAPNRNPKGRPNVTSKLFHRRDPQRSFTLPYGELRHFAEHIGGRRLTDDRAGRRMATSERFHGQDEFCNLGLIKRCISFWCKENPHTYCWDGTNYSPLLRILIFTALIPVDPEVKECREGNANDGSLYEIRRLENEVYGSGYVDFPPCPEALDDVAWRKPWPPQTSPYDALSYYLGKQWVPDLEVPIPDIPAAIVKRYVLSHMIALVEYLKSVVASLEYDLRRIPGHIGDVDFTIGRASSLELSTIRVLWIYGRCSR